MAVDISLFPVDLLLDLVRPLVPSEQARLALVAAGWLWGYRKYQKINRRLTFLESLAPPPMDIQFIQAPHYTKGRLFQKVDKIVCHWIVGDLRAADQVFTSGSRQVSAHFAVDGSQVHQYVKVGDTAWHAGHWLTNLKSIGIEHAGGPDLPISDETYETSAQLIAQLCRQLGLTPTRSLLHKHNEYVPTQCPGTLDLDRLAARAADIYNGTVRVPVNVDQPIGPAIPAILASAPRKTFEPFLTNLSPSQVYSAEVERMQRFLQAKGLMDDPQNDGYYGPLTQTAVNAFQKQNGIQSSPGYFGWWYDRTRNAANQQLTIN